MRVAILSSGLGHISRGVESWSEEIAYELYKIGVSVILFKGGGKENTCIEKVIPCLRRGLRTTKKLVKLMPSFMWRFGFGSEVQAEGVTFALCALKYLRNFDIIHTQEPPVADVILIAKKLGLIRSELIIANGTNESLKYLSKFKYVQQLTTIHLDKSKLFKGIKHKHWFAIPNFVDIEKFRCGSSVELRKKFNIPSDALVILSVAAVNKKHKRIDYLIDEIYFLQKIVDIDIYLLIVGAETNESESLIRTGKKKLGNKIIILLNQPYKLMPKIYRAADVFVLCSKHEMFGTVFLESMASGLPTIGHNDPSIRWILNRYGECLDLNKKSVLAYALLKYLNPKYRYRIGKKSRTYVNNKFSVNKIAIKLMNQYQIILDEEGRNNDG